MISKKIYSFLCGLHIDVIARLCVHLLEIIVLADLTDLTSKFIDLKRAISVFRKFYIIRSNFFLLLFLTVCSKIRLCRILERTAAVTCSTFLADSSAP